MRTVEVVRNMFFSRALWDVYNSSEAWGAKRRIVVGNVLMDEPEAIQPFDLKDEQARLNKGES